MVISVSTKLKRDPQPTIIGMMKGAIRLEVDGTVLTRFESVEDQPSVFDWPSGYVGEHIHLDLSSLVSTLLEIKEQTVDVYEEREVYLEETLGVLVLEPLSDKYIRVAFQAIPSELGEAPEMLPPPESACGYPVDIDELCREVTDCSRELLTFADEVGLSVTDTPLQQFSDNIEELERYVQPSSAER